jgi:GAF domain-containing protein
MPDTRAEMVLPLIIGQEAIGTLDIQSTVESAFTEQDLSVFTVLASLLTTALQNAFLFQELDDELETTKRDLQARVRTGWSSYLVKNRLL